MLIALIIVFIIIVLILAIWIARRQRRKGRAVVAGTAEGAANNQVYVGNLSYQVNEQDLKEFFRKYGTLSRSESSAIMPQDVLKDLVLSAIVLPAEANNALAAHGQKYKDRTIVVRIAKPR